MMDNLATDDIPNIRFNVAKSYGVLIDVLKRQDAQTKVEDVIQQRIIPNLEKLQQDADVDVRYFATTAAGGSPDMMQTSP